MPSADTKRILLARVGWMRFYNGSIPGDERPVGGGGYNKIKIGHEVYNFHDSGSYLYGYFQPTMAADAVALERIDPEAAGKAALKKYGDLEKLPALTIRDDNCRNVSESKRERTRIIQRQLHGIL